MVREIPDPKLYGGFKDANTTETSSGSRYVLKLDVTQEILMNKNYGTVFHRHTDRCI